MRGDVFPEVGFACRIGDGFIIILTVSAIPIIPLTSIIISPSSSLFTLLVSYTILVFVSVSILCSCLFHE